MISLSFLNIETLKIVKATDHSRDAKTAAEAAKMYYAKAGIHTRMQTYGDIIYLQERSCKNILFIASIEGSDRNKLKYLSERLKRLPYYSVARGFKPGIYRTWEQAKNNIDGYNTHKHKKFGSLESAIQFMRDNGAPLVCYDYLV